MSLYLQNGANPLSQTSSGRTPLHEVCVGGYVDCLKLLLFHVEDVNIKDKDGQTPTHVAAYNGESMNSLGKGSVLNFKATGSLFCVP